MLNPDQLKIIHVLKKTLGLEDEDYRNMLFDNYSVRSATELSFQQAKELITRMREQTGVKPGAGPKKYDELEGRPGMASPAQLRKIEAMWRDVSVHIRPLERNEALERFLKNRFNVNGLKWLEMSKVQKIIRALQVMIKQDQEHAAREKAKGNQP